VVTRSYPLTRGNLLTLELQMDFSGQAQNYSGEACEIMNGNRAHFRSINVLQHNFLGVVRAVSRPF
jgi:hypothetical protein